MRGSPDRAVGPSEEDEREVGALGTAHGIARDRAVGRQVASGVAGDGSRTSRYRWTASAGPAGVISTASAPCSSVRPTSAPRVRYASSVRALGWP